MEKISALSKHRFLNWRYGLLAIVLVVAAWKIHERSTRMPLIYVIPEDYSGPVVAIFDQPDGVEPTHTDQGTMVRVPENGIIKIKSKFKPLGYSAAFPKSTVVFVLEKKDGKRQVLSEAINPWQDFDKEERPWQVGIRDVQGQLRIYHPEGKGGFIFDSFPDADKNIPMVMWHESCVDRVFGPEWEEYDAGRKNAKELKIPPCGEFVIGAVNEVRKWPEWMFLRGKGKREETGPRTPHYESVQDLVEEANRRMYRKRQEILEQKFKNKRSTTEDPLLMGSSSLLPLGKTIATGAVCPQSGWWQCKASLPAAYVSIEGGDHQFFKAGQIMPQAVLVSSPTLWQKLIEGRRSFRYPTPTLWQLDAYDEATMTLKKEEQVSSVC